MGKMQRLVFWQNIISPHQVDFLKEISAIYKITLVVDADIDEYRKKDGWQVPDYTFMELYICPNEKTINSLFENSESIHVFSGLGAYKYVNKGFKKAIREKSKIGIFSEPVEINGFKGAIKLIKGNFQRMLYGKKIDFICATGKLGVQTYLNFGYKSKKIFDWAYFIDPLNLKVRDRENTLVFVGQLVERKRIIDLLNLLILEDFFGFDSFKIVGKGKCKNKIEKILKINNISSKVSVLGRLSQKETYDTISKSKLLIIPSKHDGWGVVVNEALLCGTPVIASSNVGSSVLLDGKNRGEVFESNNWDDLKKVLNKWSNKKLILEDNSNIKNWAESKISPKVASSYFKDILDYVYNKSENKPVIPWIK